MMTVDRSRLPMLGAARPFRFPSIEKSTLANGLRVWSIRHTSIPVVALMLLVKRGAADDPPGKEGLAAITVDMMDEGSGDRSAIEIHEGLARLGAQLDSDIGADATLLTVTALSRFAAPTMSLLADIAARPSLREEDFVRVRQLRLHRLTQLRDMPGAVADRAFVRLLYGTHPYGHTPLGSEPSLTSLSIDDVRAFHHAMMRPSDATIVVAGDCHHHDIVALAGMAFDNWTGSAQGELPSSSALPLPARLNVIPRPGAPQSELRIGHVGIPRNHPDFFAVNVMNAILGGLFNSRINLNLREAHGYTYGAFSVFDWRRQAGPFLVQPAVKSDITDAAAREVFAEIDRIRAGRVTEDELSLATSYLDGVFPIRFETTVAIAAALSVLVVHGLPEDYYDRYRERVRGVTRDQIFEAAQRHLHPEALQVVVVGDPAVVQPRLAALEFGPVALYDAAGQRAE